MRGVDRETGKPATIYTPPEDVVAVCAVAPICPECEQGKHGNCDGTALDEEHDEFTLCACNEAGHG